MIISELSKQAQADLDEAVESFKISKRLGRRVMRAIVEARNLSVIERRIMIDLLLDEVSK